MKKIFLFIYIIYSEGIFRFFVIPAILFTFWLFASIALVYYPPSFSVVSKYHEKNSIENFSDKKIFKGNSIKGAIEASENNLGILVIRFNPSEAVAYKEEDKLLFKIKEEGKNSWIAQNFYKSGLINEYPFFPFGFPKIMDSKGKTYEFEITSLEGNSKNAVSLSSINPIMESQYQFTKAEIFSNSRSFYNFIFIKISNFFADKDSIFLSFPYLLPFLVYILLTFLQKTSPVALLIVIAAIFADAITNYRTVYNAGEIILVLVWIFCIRKYKLDISASLLLSFTFMVFALYGILSNKPLILQKSSEWAYYLLAGAILSLVYGIKNSSDRFFSLWELFIKRKKL